MYYLTQAIVTKAASSNFLSSVAGRFFNGHAEENSDYPYCVFLLPVSNDPQSLSTFDRDYEETKGQFSIYSKEHSPSEILTIYGYLTSLYDDCSFSITGRTLIKMERINESLMIEDHTVKDGTIQVRHYAVEYLIVTKVG